MCRYLILIFVVCEVLVCMNTLHLAKPHCSVTFQLRMVLPVYPRYAFVELDSFLDSCPSCIPEFHAISTMYSFGGIPLNFHDCNSFIFFSRNESRSKSRNAVFLIDHWRSISVPAVLRVEADFFINSRRGRQPSAQGKAYIRKLAHRNLNKSSEASKDD